MSISYEEALQTLQSMFSGYTPQQLDALLRHHGGHMEHTVETMLAYADRSPEEVLEKLKDLPAEGVGDGGASGGSGGGGSGGRPHAFDADEELARQLAAEEQQQQQSRGAAVGGSRPPPLATGRSTHHSTGGGGGVSGLGKALGNMFGGGGSSSSSGSAFPGQSRPALPKNSWAAPSSLSTGRVPSSRAPPPDAFPSSAVAATKKGRGTPTVLPEEFLRVPGRKHPASSSSSSSGSNAVSSSSSGGAALTDEQLARMLQDELFQEELRNNPEFSHLAGRGHMGFRNGSGQRTGRSTYGGPRGGGGGGAGSGGVAWNERTDIFDRLSELGDAAKRRFQEFAANWGDPNRPQAQNHSDSASGGGNPRRHNERRGLLSNDLDMDEEEEEEELNFVGGGRGGSGEFVELGDVRGAGSKKKD
ncbi:hypothetical protein ACHAXS_009946 [Conticribra weissflogii]